MSGPIIDICLVEPQGAVNVGSVARLCANFRINDLQIVSPKTRLGKEAQDFACGGKQFLEQVKIFTSVEEAVSQEHHFIIGTTGKTGKEREALGIDQLSDIQDVFLPGQKVLLLFGRESSGLHQSELLHCDYTIKINLKGEYPILNLSHAVSIILYEIQKLGGLARNGEQGISQKANGAEVMAFIRNLESFLSSFDYYQKKERHYHRRVFEELIRKKSLSADEIRFLQGVFRVHKNYLRSASNSS